MKKCILRLLLSSLAIVVLSVGAGVSADTPQPPNFLVIIADDMGYSDAGCYGGEISTPNLDALAAGGLRFTQFYNTSRCWPTRAALLTGYYPQQTRRDQMPGLPEDAAGKGKRPPWAPLIAEHLSDAGYRTYHSGKWHIDGSPTRSGFDRSDETNRGHGFFESTKRKDRDPSYYQTIHTAEHAIDCLREHAEVHCDKPFFQYVAFRAPHFPLHALPEDIECYRDRYLGGWDELRQERHERQNQLGLKVAELSPLEKDIGPPYAFPDQIEQLGPGEINRPLSWNTLTKEQQRFQATKMAIHAAMIDRMDREIGKILDQLRAMDAFEETLICLLSDNGASAEIMVRGDGHDPIAPPGSAATYLCLGPGFSSAANTPFRRHKSWVHEGGISTPFIAHWPIGIKAKNKLRSTLAHVIDLAPTMLDLAGIEVASTDGPPMSGTSLRTALERDGVTGHDELWFCHEGNHALRQGKWKLVRGDNGRPFPYRFARPIKEFPAWHLYDLSNDRAEQHDLAAAEPERVESMARRWDELRVQYLADSLSP